MKRKKLTDAERIKTALARLDEVATVFERKWGVGRLVSLVDQPLAEAFERQLSKLNAALKVYTADAVLPHVEAMIKGWHALDAAVDAAGAARVDTAAWEIVTPAGRKIAFVSDVRTYKALAREGWEIWSAAEVGNIIDSFDSEIGSACDTVHKVKQLWPDTELRFPPNDEVPTKTARSGL